MTKNIIPFMTLLALTALTSACVDKKTDDVQLSKTENTAEASIPTIKQYSDHKAMARDIFANVISYRTAKGHGQIPAMASYLSKQLKTAGFSDDDIVITDHIDGDATIQGMMVYYRADEPAAKKPIVLLAHMDVVDALPEDWDRDPFTLIEEDGYFFGRGTLDNKYGIANLVATFMRLKSEGWVPNRDLVLVFSGDEETNMTSTKAQADFVAEHIDPEFVLNTDAGGGLLGPDNSGLYYAVQAAEKLYATFELTVKNPGGHSSWPREDNAIYDLAQALTKIQNYEFPVRHNEITRAYFKIAGDMKPGSLGEAMIAFSENPEDAEAAALLRSDPEMIGATGTTCVATMLRGGHAENALPQSATATVNCRIFPGVTAEETEQRLKDVVDNENVAFDMIWDDPASPPSKIHPDILGALKSSLTARGFETPIVPMMESGATDGMHYRVRGYDTVGIAAYAYKSSDMFMHGLNERIAVDEFYAGLDHWYIILKELATN